MLHHPNLWHFNRHCVAGAFGVGLFCMWLPFPVQSIIAAILAIILRVNLPLSVLLVYLTNPVTIPPMFFAAYKLGAWVLGETVRPVKFTLSLDWFQSTLELIWQPLVLGSLIIATVSSMIGYYGIHFIWRLHLLQRIKARRERRGARKKEELTTTFQRVDKE